MEYQLDSHGEMLMEQYRERIPVYERLSQLADKALRSALNAQNVRVTTMEYRIKTESSLAGKLELKGAKYRKCTAEPTLLCIFVHVSLHQKERRGSEPL